MSTSAIAAFGTLNKKVSTTIAEVTSLSTPECSVTMEDAMSHDSASAWEEFIPTVLSGGTVELTVNWIPADATHKALISDCTGKTSAVYNIIYPDAGECTQTFTAYVERVRPGADVKGKLQLTATLRITGPVEISY